MCVEEFPSFSETDHLNSEGPEHTHNDPVKKDGPIPVFTKKENATLAQRIEVLVSRSDHHVRTSCSFVRSFEDPRSR